MTQQEVNSLRLDLSIIDQHYEKWAAEDDSLSGVLNTKLTKVKNAEFRLKLDSWKNRKLERKNLKKRGFEHGKALRTSFENCKTMFNMDRDKIFKCIDEYNSFSDNKVNHARDCKVINDFLGELPEASHSVIELNDLDRLAKNEAAKFHNRLQVLNEFTQCVKQECVINQNFFIFFDVPDMVVKKRYPRKDYEDILKILLKVKTRYLAEKARLMPEKPLEIVSQITDDDLIPLELFDCCLAEFQNKNKEKKQTIQ